MVGLELKTLAQVALGVPMPTVLQSLHSALELLFEFCHQSFTSVGWIGAK